MIAAVRSGTGKTSIATGLMGAFVRRGSTVQGFKVGPDYIDPGYHTAVTGRWSRNLDTWLLSCSQVRDVFRSALRDADLAVIEGVMGIFDGLRGRGERASSAEIAKLLGCPVILVLDVHAQARSAVVEYLGCRTLDPELPLAGVILNRVQGPGHLEILEESFRAEKIPIFGAIRDGSLPRFDERPLGLAPILEQQGYGSLSELTEAVEQQVDLDDIWQMAEAAPDCFRSSLKERFAPGRIRIRSGVSRRGGATVPSRDQAPVDQTNGTAEKVCVAFARDEAFNFYYKDGLDLLEKAGAELVSFSPLRDRCLPPGARGILIGGGFPERFAGQLAANTDMHACLRQAHTQGLPIYAEGGGYMYLCRSLRDPAGITHSMVGLIPGSCRMEKHLVGMGYVTARALDDNLFCRAGDVLRGHEFHYSAFVPDRKHFSWAFSFSKGKNAEWSDGYASSNLLASYLHFHFASTPGAVRRFVNFCRIYQE